MAQVDQKHAGARLVPLHEALLITCKNNCWHGVGGVRGGADSSYTCLAAWFLILSVLVVSQARVRQVDPSATAEVERELARLAARRKAAEAKQRRDLSSFLDR